MTSRIQSRAFVTLEGSRKNSNQIAVKTATAGLVYNRKIESGGRSQDVVCDGFLHRGTRAMSLQGTVHCKTIQTSNGLTASGYEKISKQHIRQIIRPQPVPSRSGPFKTVSTSSSRARRRRKGEAALGVPKGNRWGEGLRVPVPRELGTGRGSPVHVRTQMAHVDALHLRRGEGNESGGLDLRPIVRWHEVHVEILEGFREAAKRFGVSRGTREFDKRRRRLS
ncbi:hypothetical protein EDB92DRAFT_1820676 [Lactarius akahatsu]|uniref:Uncharacterized protein n=1 Tax=Lactarius akahatsu TaxID=416441 RepID=A0AAD4L4L7_9AGAM|nr:hypothetical protein EDB92DRAFT_1820676 [Lactarius akahatsu]